MTLLLGEIALFVLKNEIGCLTIIYFVFFHKCNPCQKAVCSGGCLNVIGKEIPTLKPVSVLTSSITDDLSEIKGQIVYIDSFGNCVTNISQKQFNDTIRGRNFEIVIKNKKFSRLHKSYSDFPVSDVKQLKDLEGDFLALFNENGYLEIAIYKSNPKTVGSAATLLGLHFRDAVS